MSRYEGMAVSMNFQQARCLLAQPSQHADSIASSGLFTMDRLWPDRVTGDRSEFRRCRCRQSVLGFGQRCHVQL